MLYIRNYNSDKIEIRLNFLQNIQKRINIEAAILKRRYRLNGKKENKENTENTEKIETTETTENTDVSGTNGNSEAIQVIEVLDDDGQEKENNSEQVEVFNPVSDDNKPIEYSLVSSDSINEPTNDNMLLSSEGDFNIENNNENIIEGNETTEIVEYGNPSESNNNVNVTNNEGKK